MREMAFAGQITAEMLSEVSERVAQLPTDR